MFSLRPVSLMLAFLLFLCLGFAQPAHCAEKPQGPLRVALLLETPTGDNDWNDSLVDGLRQAERELGIKASVITAQPGHDEAALQEMFRTAAGNNDLVLVASNGLHEVLRNNAANFRRTMFGCIDAGIRALWTLHDDSRPADDRCFETLLDAWRNTPTAALLGAKQLDWQAKNLHNVGLYAGHHDVVSLVVDGEPDQEQYDGRQDVLSVSLSGALVPLATLRAFEGADPWFGTFAESTDLCRRICLGGGRVVVVPQARIAHRRARFEGIRSKNGRPVEDEDGRIDPYLAVREANAKYAYTDMHRSWWPLLWLWSIIQSLGLAVLCLARK